ncbi:MAG TPA: hypothetical protein VL287_05145 [Gemmatimonadales bacterium]|nr:hypothetical protein [Gemmatimonadales bacterium]
MHKPGFTGEPRAVIQVVVVVEVDHAPAREIVDQSVEDSAS